MSHDPEATRPDERPRDAVELPAAADRYELRGELGRGGIGCVLRAFDRAIEREVAIKELFEEGSERARFLREARLTGQLEHPGVVPVYDVGTFDDGRLYYSMKVVRGETLAKRLARATELDARLRQLPVFLRVVQTMAHAHGRGVIHRDLKPANVMVGELGETIVLDWGLAKRIGVPDDPVSMPTPDLGPELTQEGIALGTPAYMSPEQIRGKSEQIDARADVWALGVILFSLLTGKRPFEGTNTGAVLRKIVRNERPKVRELEPRVPAALATLCERCLEGAASERYPSAAELAAELERYIEGGIVEAHRYSPAERAWRFVRRHRAAIAKGAIAIAALAFVGLWLLCAQLFRAGTRELDDATLALFSRAAERARVQALAPLPDNDENAARPIVDAIHRCLLPARCMPYPWFYEGAVTRETPIEHARIPEVDRLREAARAGRYQAWGRELFPAIGKNAYELPVLRFSDVQRLIELGLLRARALEIAGDLEGAGAWYADLLIVAHHLEQEIGLGLIVGVQSKIAVAAAAGEHWHRRGDEASAERWAQYAELERRRVKALREAIRGAMELTRGALDRVAHDPDVVVGVRTEAFLAQMTRAHYATPVRMMFGPPEEELHTLVARDSASPTEPTYELGRLVIGRELDRGFGSRLAYLLSAAL